MKKLWGGRFSKNTSNLTDEFNASISFDQELYHEDIRGSLAHAQMLAKQGILTEDEYRAIEKGLTDILKDIQEGNFEFKTELEDIHMNIESELTDRIGEAGKKLHTARSRNDQVATDLVLYVKNACENLITLLKENIKIFLELSKKHTETIMPGYTHLQRAQPITYGHYLLAYIQMFRRDINKLKFILDYQTAENPLGAGALAGSTYNIDRNFTSELLGFVRPKQNTLDAVSDRDYAIDFLESCAVIMMHLSRFSEEMIIYNSAEFNFIELDDAFTTGSSIMPQKKNPDISELIRGKTGRTYGNLISLLTTMKGLPLAYNKDMQEDKEPIFDSYKTVSNSLEILKELMKTINVKKENMHEAASGSFTNATDLADWLVKHGIPFRDAHAIVGELVLFCESRGISLNEITLDELKEKNEIFDSTVFDAISLDTIVNNRKVIGGPSKEALQESQREIEDWLSTL